MPDSQRFRDAFQRRWYRLLLASWRRRGAELGPETRVFGRPVLLGRPANLTLGARCTLNHGVVLNVRDRLTIGDDVHLSAYSQLYTGTLDMELLPRGHTSAPITVSDDVWLGSASIVVGGVTIGAGSVVAGGSVVVRDVPPATLVAGVPAKPIRGLDLQRRD